MGRAHPPPPWALATAGPGDRLAAAEAHRAGTLHTNWDPHPLFAGLGYAGKPLIRAPRAWAKAHGWPAPWLSFGAAFLTAMLSSAESFALALGDSGAELYFPKTEHLLPAEELKELDALYASRSADGRPDSWGSLVEALREIRRAVEAGVAVQVEGKTLESFGSFYAWAHGRYHMLEDGYDRWIGDDRS